MALVLVIDDDVMMRTLTAGALAMGGHQVMQAEGGAQGLEMARTEQPDLVVSDVVMPGMTGFEFVASLRQEEGISDLPVILLTTMDDRANMRVGMNSGADDYIGKPFSPEELNEAVAALLAKRRTLHDGVMASMSSTFIAAMDEQRELLAAQYEKRFVSELSARWDRVDEHNTEMNHPAAVVLQADLFGPLLERISTSPDSSRIVRKAYEGVRDALHLFSAQHVLGTGHDLLGVFLDEPDAVRATAGMRAAKAAFAVSRAVRTAVQPILQGASADDQQGQTARSAVCMHRGPLKLLHVDDPLHGGPPSVIATGPVVSDLAAMREFSRASGWPIAVSAAANEVIDKAVVGRTGRIPVAPGREAFDVLEFTGIG